MYITSCYFHESPKVRYYYPHFKREEGKTQDVRELAQGHQLVSDEDGGVTSGLLNPKACILKVSATFPLGYCDGRFPTFACLSVHICVCPGVCVFSLRGLEQRHFIMLSLNSHQCWTQRRTTERQCGHPEVQPLCVPSEIRYRSPIWETGSPVLREVMYHTRSNLVAGLGPEPEPWCSAKIYLLMKLSLLKLLGWDSYYY